MCLNFLLNVLKSQGFDCSFTWAISRIVYAAGSPEKSNALLFFVAPGCLPDKPACLLPVIKAADTLCTGSSPVIHPTAYVGSTGPPTLP